MYVCSGEDSNLQRDNPLYESQEIRMEMFADVSDDEEEGTVQSCLLACIANGILHRTLRFLAYMMGHDIL